MKQTHGTILFALGVGYTGLVFRKCSIFSRPGFKSIPGICGPRKNFFFKYLFIFKGLPGKNVIRPRKASFSLETKH